jgi:glycosyltransferase involved in cell wall biosynthesis
MKTLHVDTGREMGGGQWQVIYLLERLPGAALLARGPLVEQARRRGIDARPLSFAALVRGARGFDLIHAHDARAHTLAVFAGAGPLVVSRRVGFPVRSRWKYSRAARFIAVSKFVANKLMEAGVSAEKIREIFDGVPIPERSTTRTGGAVALAGKCEHLVRAAAESAGVPVHFTSNLWQDLSTAAIFIYASEMEGLGSAALAAMASGVPVIATRAGGLVETVEHERTGLLVEPGEIGAALARLAGDPAEAAAMGEHARELAMRKFSAQAMADATIQVYREVLAC